MTDSNWIKLADVVVGAMTAVAVVIIGYLLNARSKNLETALSVGETLMGKRMEIYDSIAPLLNDIYCFLVCVGHWKEISPKSLVERKRKADRIFYVSRTYFGEDVTLAYESFMGLAFETGRGRGESPRIRAHRDRHLEENLAATTPDFAAYFVDPEERTKRGVVSKAYDRLILAFRSEFTRGTSLA